MVASNQSVITSESILLSSNRFLIFQILRSSSLLGTEITMVGVILTQV